ncbi:MAG: septal ring lytic transglycosylase RlpA family protein [Chlorobi bacterium]|nr:septal ring lytic transglycosylase RlpA family protein [Chlorobiota bacterium]
MGFMTASWYGPKFHGKLTANGEVYDQMAFTAAHKSLPFGTMLKLTNLENGKSVVVRINDRGPYIKGRDIDLSKGAATALGSIKPGVIKVKVEQLVVVNQFHPFESL